MDVPPQHRRFAEDVAASKAQDPMPTFANLSAATGVPVDDLVHFALVRWAAAGSEMLIPPVGLELLLEDGIRADRERVGLIVVWLAAEPRSGS